MAAADIVKLISWKELPGAVNFVDHWYLLDKNVCLYNSETCGLRCTESNWYLTILIFGLLMPMAKWDTQRTKR